MGFDFFSRKGRDGRDDGSRISQGREFQHLCYE